MIAAQQVGAARAMHPGPPRALVEERRQLRLQVVEIAGRVFVQDDGIGRQPLEPPVLLRLQHLAHQLEVLGPSADADQQDRQVARDAVAPQSLLALLVGGALLGHGAERLVHVEQAGGEPLEEPGILR